MKKSRFTICNQSGHSIKSLQVGTKKATDGLFIPVFELLCTQCGRSLAEIRRAK